MQEVLSKKQKAEGGRKPSSAKLNNMIMQMRKNCNHPDLISGDFTNDVYYPDSKELIAQCGKLQLLDRLLRALKAKGHKVLIFSQVRPQTAASTSLPGLHRSLPDRNGDRMLSKG